MVKVTINSVPKNRVSIDNQSQSVVRTTSVGSVTSVSTLSDVDLEGLEDGEALVWDSNLQKFVVRLISLDGGDF